MGKWSQKNTPCKGTPAARSIPNGGVIMGRPCRAYGFITDQTHGIAMGYE